MPKANNVVVFAPGTSWLRDDKLLAAIEDGQPEFTVVDGCKTCRVACSRGENPCAINLDQAALRSQISGALAVVADTDARCKQADVAFAATSTDPAILSVAAGGDRLAGFTGKKCVGSMELRPELWCTEDALELRRMIERHIESLAGDKE